MSALLERADALAKAAQGRLVEKIAREWRERGFAAVADASSVTVLARRLRQRRLDDLRFVGIER